MKNKIEDLRDILFDQLGKLQKCEDERLDIECQRTVHVVQIADTIIDSARAESEFLALGRLDGTQFIPLLENGNRK